MIKPSVSVSAKSLLTVEMSIVPVTGDSVKFLISEGAKVTNLKYLEDGKEVITSGAVKVIKWNFVKLPENDTSCVHNTKSMFNRQCQPKSLIVDCSGEFESDVREIPILAIRGCDAIEAGGDTDPVQDQKPILTHANIDGILDVESGDLTNVSVMLTFDPVVAEEDLDAFMDETHLTITDTPIQNATLSTFECTIDAEGRFNLAIPDTLSMEELSANDMVVVQNGNGTNIYTLTAADVPVWEKPVIELNITTVTIDETTRMGSFGITNATAETDPIVAVLNGHQAVDLNAEDMLSDEVVVGRTYTFDPSAYDMVSSGNSIKVVGPNYALTTAEFDGLPARAGKNTDITTEIMCAIASIKTHIANGDYDAADCGRVPVLFDIPADQQVTGIRFEGIKTYDNSTDSVMWEFGDDSLYTDLAVIQIDNIAYMNILPLMTMPGSVDVTVLAAGSTARSTRTVKAIEYPIGTITLNENKDVTITKTELVGGSEGYKKDLVNTETGMLLIREHETTQVAVTPTIGGTAIPNGSLMLLVGGTGVISVSLFTGTVLLPEIEVGGPVVETSTEQMEATVVFPELGGTGAIKLTINNMVRPEMAVDDETINVLGDIDYDGNIKNASISFVLSRDVDKTAVANATLKIYGTAIDGSSKIGVLTTDITVTDGKSVVVKLPTTMVLNAHGLEDGTIAVLRVADEVCIADCYFPTYEPPVFRGAAITGTPDFGTGAMPDANLVLTFNETLDLANMSVVIGTKGPIRLADVAGITNENGVITVPLTDANAGDYQDDTKVTVTVTRGNETFVAVMTKGTHYPTWETPPVLQRVELVGEPNRTTGMIANPVLKVTLDKTSNMADATLTIEAMGITDVALTGPNAVPVDNVVSVSLTGSVSMAGVPDSGVVATMTNKTYVQDYTMVVETDYPKYVELPVELVRVQITDDAAPETPTATIANATITLTFNKPVENASLINAAKIISIDGSSGESMETELGTANFMGLTVNDDYVATIAMTNLNMEFTGTLVGVVSGTSMESGDAETIEYRCNVAAGDYPVYQTPEN